MTYPGAATLLSLLPRAAGRLAAAAVVVILAAGCATASVASNARGSGSPVRSPGQHPLVGSVWQLVSYTGSSGTSTPVRIDATLRFDGKAYSAHACNYLGGPARVGATTVTFGQSTETLIGCPSALGAIDNAVAGTLTGIAHWVIANQKLTITGQDGQVLVYRVRASIDPHAAATTTTTATTTIGSAGARR